MLGLTFEWVWFCMFHFSFVIIGLVLLVRRDETEMFPLSKKVSTTSFSSTGAPRCGRSRLPPPRVLLAGGTVPALWPGAALLSARYHPPPPP